MTGKRASGGVNSPGGSSGRDYLVRIPQGVINDILEKLDLGTLCSAACVCRVLRSSVSQVLSSSPTLDLSSFSADDKTLSHIRHRFGKLKSVTFDCLRLDNFYLIGSLLGEHTQELNLWKGSSLSSDVLAYIGDRCPNLRILLVELASGVSADRYKKNLTYMLKRCSLLESLCIKNRGPEYEPSGCHFKELASSLPSTVQVLKLQSLIVRDAVDFIRDFGEGRKKSTEISSPVYPSSPSHALQSVSLVLDFISDELIITIASSLPLLAELDLEDRPSVEPMLPNDLTNNGLQSLGFCQHLISLSLVRSKLYVPVSFKRVNDMGMFLLSECCKGLQTFRLGGFSKVSDAGFAAILHSCQNLKRFEIRNASQLSDLAFHDINGAPCSLSDVKLWSCSLITSESVKELASSRELEVLDLSGCRSVADSCLSSISSLCNLTTLNLAGADVTDDGLASMGDSDSPITQLSLRGCKRITDKGIGFLFNGDGAIRKTLTSLDLGSLPGISDKAISTINAAAPSITELCIRFCYFVTDASLEELASERRSEEGKSLLRKLDLFHCNGLSINSLGLLKKPFFRGLQWVGVGSTNWTSKGDHTFRQIRDERPWLTLCLDGCEMGCHDGWQFHKFGGN